LGGEKRILCPVAVIKKSCTRGAIWGKTVGTKNGRYSYLLAVEGRNSSVRRGKKRERPKSGTSRVAARVDPTGETRL